MWTKWFLGSTTLNPAQAVGAASGAGQLGYVVQQFGVSGAAGTTGAGSPTVVFPINFTKVQSAHTETGVFAAVTSSTAAFTNNTLSNLLVVTINAGINTGIPANQTDPTVTDTAGNTYTLIKAEHGGTTSGSGDNAAGWIYACLAGAKTFSGTNTVTVSFGSSQQNFISIYVAEFSASVSTSLGWTTDQTASTSDGDSTGNNPNAQMTATTGTTTQTYEIAVATNSNWTNNPTSGTGWTDFGAGTIFVDSEYQFLSAKAAITASWKIGGSTPNVTADYATVIATFYPTPPASGSPSPSGASAAAGAGAGFITALVTTAGITGTSETTGAGNFTPDPQAIPTGSQASTAASSPSFISISFPLTGGSGTTAAPSLVETVKPNTSGGSGTTGAAGLTEGSGGGTSGGSGTTGSGSFLIAIAVPLTGASAAAQVGTVTVSSGTPTTTVNIPGTSAATGASNLAESVTTFPSGPSSSTAAGSTLEAITAFLSGSSGTATASSLAEAIGAILSGGSTTSGANSLHSTIIGILSGGASSSSSGSPAGGVTTFVTGTSEASAAGATLGHPAATPLGGSTSTGAGSSSESIIEFQGGGSATSSGGTLTFLLFGAGVAGVSNAGTPTNAISFVDSSSSASSGAGTVPPQVAVKVTSGASAVGAGGIVPQSGVTFNGVSGSFGVGNAHDPISFMAGSAGSQAYAGEAYWQYYTQNTGPGVTMGTSGLAVTIPLSAGVAQALAGIPFVVIIGEFIPVPAFAGSGAAMFKPQIEVTHDYGQTQTSVAKGVGQITVGISVVG